MEDVDPSRIHRMGSTPIHRGCSESLKGVDPSMIHRMRSTLVYKGYPESLMGVDPSMIHGVRSILVSKGSGESLEGVDPARSHGMRSTLSHEGCGTPCRLVWTSCGEAWKGLHPSRIYCTPVDWCRPHAVNPGRVYPLQGFNTLFVECVDLMR